VFNKMANKEIIVFGMLFVLMFSVLFVFAAEGDNEEKPWENENWEWTEESAKDAIDSILADQVGGFAGSVEGARQWSANFGEEKMAEFSKVLEKFKGQDAEGKNSFLNGLEATQKMAFMGAFFEESGTGFKVSEDMSRGGQRVSNSERLDKMRFDSDGNLRYGEGENAPVINMEQIKEYSSSPETKVNPKLLRVSMGDHGLSYVFDNQDGNDETLASIDFAEDIGVSFNPNDGVVSNLDGKEIAKWDNKRGIVVVKKDGDSVKVDLNAVSLADFDQNSVTRIPGQYPGSSDGLLLNDDHFDVPRVTVDGKRYGSAELITDLDLDTYSKLQTKAVGFSDGSVHKESDIAVGEKRYFKRDTSTYSVKNEGTEDNPKLVYRELSAGSISIDEETGRVSFNELVIENRDKGKDGKGLGGDVFAKGRWDVLDESSELTEDDYMKDFVYFGNEKGKPAVEINSGRNSEEGKEKRISFNQNEEVEKLVITASSLGPKSRVNSNVRIANGGGRLELESSGEVDFSGHGNFEYDIAEVSVEALEVSDRFMDVVTPLLSEEEVEEVRASFGVKEPYFFEIKDGKFEDRAGVVELDRISNIEEVQTQTGGGEQSVASGEQGGSEVRISPDATHEEALEAFNQLSENYQRTEAVQAAVQGLSAQGRSNNVQDLNYGYIDSDFNNNEGPRHLGVLEFDSDVFEGGENIKIDSYADRFSQNQMTGVGPNQIENKIKNEEVELRVSTQNGIRYGRSGDYVYQEMNDLNQQKVWVKLYVVCDDGEISYMGPTSAAKGVSRYC
jgi:hypothetical protein